MSYCTAFPIDGFQLIDQDRTIDWQSGRNHDLERITFYFGHDRAHHRQICFRVELNLGQYQGGASAGLLASQCGIEIKIDKIAAFWNVSRRGRSPGFLADRLAPINQSVAVLRRNPADELMQIVSERLRRNYYQPAGPDLQVDHGAFLEPGRFRKGGGDTHRKAIAPL